MTVPACLVAGLLAAAAAGGGGGSTVTLSSVSASFSGSWSVYDQSVTLTADTTSGTIQHIQWSIDGGASWSDVGITPAASITGTYGFALSVGSYTISLRAIDALGTISATTNLSVLVHAMSVSWTPSTCPNGTVTSIAVNFGPPNTAIFWSGTYEPSGTPVNSSAVGTTDSSGGLGAVMGASSWGSNTSLTYVIFYGSTVIGSGTLVP